MVNEKIQNVLSRLEKDIDYENSHRDEIPGEKRLNCISKNIGMFYNTLLMSINAKKILEIGMSVGYSGGMSVGYSGLWFADAVMLNTQSDGQIITIEREKFKIDNATQNFEEAGVGSLIKIREGEARKILHEIKEEFSENYFDFIFIDADKESYIEYFDLCLPLVRKGGIIGADNILFPERFNEMMADYLSHVKSKPNVQSVTVPIDNGEEVTIKLS
jgi:predicted O-methyltransferase YrrM